MSDNETGAPFRECLSRFLQQFGFVPFATDEGRERYRVRLFILPSQFI